MILIDIDLDPSAAADALASTSAKQMAVSTKDKNLRLPSALTLARFLTQAQKTVRLKGEVTVLLTTDAAIRKLNHRFRGKNQVTDVLSFPAVDPIRSSHAEKIVGDLAISVPTARRQAVDQNHSLSTEIKVLILHGLLHLAGHDHEADNGQMARRERFLRARLNLPLGLIERIETRVPQVPRLGPGKPRNSTRAGCPILSRSLRKGGKPQPSTRQRVPRP